MGDVERIFAIILSMTVRVFNWSVPKTRPELRHSVIFSFWILWTILLEDAVYSVR